MGTKSFFFSFLLLGLILSGSFAFASSNVPMQSWVYDHLERLVNTGLVDHASLAMKPLSRQEVAEILAQVIHKIEKNNEETYGFRNVLVEDQLMTLIEEFKWELQRMGAYPLGEKAEAKWYSLKPLDTAQIKLGYAEDPFLLENSNADKRAQGFNLRLGGTSRVELAEYVSLYVHPEYRYDDKENKGYFLETYGKLTLFNVELEVGRDNQWWGPGYHGSLLLSSNALPLDLVKLSSATPFQLPWIFRYLGFFELNFFLAKLEEHRDSPYTKLMGMRMNYAPAPFLELGFSRVILCDGEAQPSYSLGDYWDVLTTTHTTTPGEEQAGVLETDQIYSFDVTLRLRNIGRYFPLATSIVLYGEFGGEDMPGEFTVIPRSQGIQDANPGYIGGILLQDLFTLEGLDFRAEYGRTNQIWYQHHFFTSGYTYKGVIIGHHMGGNSDDLYFRLSHWLNKNFQVALDFDQERHGLTPVPKPLPGRTATTVQVTERYLESSILLFRPQDIPLSAMLACRVIDTKNADFEPGENHTNYLLRLECSYEF